ncbi:acyl-CoA dehydrogenase family protein [Reyranella sp.]|uniref:acyl-CoA dehydrogenase family protein n=1 Tax=Reyranella sp. TaxID=1929291 RepID=UPI00121ECC74|nr:acyl-CoA dehydrogenase family protein [Reyranella sp.]TAJ82092.1 MAG: acyl-CoA dehydrogenase [Reyranella sp.]
MKSWALVDLPFFEPRHETVAATAKAWIGPGHLTRPVRLLEEARQIVRSFAGTGLLDIVVPHAERGETVFDVRAICIAREALAYQNVLADAMFTMQGLGTALIGLHGTSEQKSRYLPPARAGESIAALAISEPDAGSDVAAIATSARMDDDGFVLDGHKTWISNAGIADHYIVLARTEEAPGARGLSAFIVDAGTPGLSTAPIDLIVPHPIGSLTFDACRVPKSALLGERGQGFKLAMATFDYFRPSVGAAAVGAARRALDESIRRVRERRMFGRSMAQLEGVQAKLADMTVDVETAALSVYRAAWHKDTRGLRGSLEASIAKLVATEAAQRVVDSAVQLFGGAGIVEGGIIGQLYREVRPMRIYEGASEVQKLVIARSVLAGACP